MRRLLIILQGLILTLASNVLANESAIRASHVGQSKMTGDGTGTCLPALEVQTAGDGTGTCIGTRDALDFENSDALSKATQADMKMLEIIQDKIKSKNASERTVILEKIEEIYNEANSKY